VNFNKDTIILSGYQIPALLMFYDFMNLGRIRDNFIQVWCPFMVHSNNGCAKVIARLAKSVEAMAE